MAPTDFKKSRPKIRWYPPKLGTIYAVTLTFSPSITNSKSMTLSQYIFEPLPIVKPNGLISFVMLQLDKYLESNMVRTVIRHFELPVSTRDVLFDEPGILHSIKLFWLRSTTTSSSHSSVWLEWHASSEGIDSTATSLLMLFGLHLFTTTGLLTLFTTSWLSCTVFEILTTGLHTLISSIQCLFTIFVWEFWRSFSDCASLNRHRGR